jgi:hypothetical protein
MVRAVGNLGRIRGVCLAMLNRTRTLFFGLALLVACGPEATQHAGNKLPKPSGLLWVEIDGGLAAVELPEGDVRMEIPNAVVGRDFSEIYSTRYNQGTTTLIRWDPGVAAHLTKMTIRGTFAANVAGPGGKVALTEPRSEGATPWLPDGRRRTTVVVGTPDAGVERRYRLLGNFEPEAFSTNGRRLYMIEYIPPDDPDRYRVRILSLRTGRVFPIGRLKGAPDQMRGTGRTQVFAPDGDELYTLYTRQGPNYAHGAPAGPSRSRTNAFVHQLNLEEGWAHCIDLPLPFGRGRATASSIDISPDGKELYVSDWTNGAVAIVDPAEVKVLRVAQLPLGDRDDKTFSVASSSGLLYVAGNDTVVTIDTSSLRVVNRWRMDGDVTGLEVSPDGRTVFVAVADAIVMIDSATGTHMDTLPIGPVDDILYIG